MAAPITLVREYVGTTPDDDAIMAMLNAHDGDAHGAARSILRVRLADMIAHPAKWAVVDDYSQDTSANIAAVRAQIAAIDDEIAGIAPGAWRQIPIVGPSMAR